MCAACPPQSPAVAKTEITLDGDSPLLAATFAYWDNILGPRVRHIWAPKCEQLLLSDGEITFLANHTLNGEILRSAKSGAIDVKFFVLSEKGVIIISLIFDGNMNGDRSTYALSVILPQTELGFYLPLHRLCVDRLTHIIRKGRIWMYKGQSIISFLTTEITPIMELFSSMKTHGVLEEVQIKDTVLNDDDIGDSCHEDFLHKAISSHLQTCGCSVVVGSNPEKVNKMVRTLCLFLTPNERKCSRLANASGSFKYNSGLFVQGLLKDATGSFVLPYRQIMYAPYPTTHIDVDVNTVKQMAPCHEHIYNQQNYMNMELVTLQKTASEEVVIPDTIIHMDESFTPNLNIFQDVMNRDTLVKSFLDQIFQLKSGLSLRSIFLAQFLLVLHRKAQTVIKYIEDETQRGKKPFRSLRNLKIDLDLAVEDLKICRSEVMSAADLQVTLRNSLEGTGDNSQVVQLKSSMGSKNIIPKLPSREKQNPAHEIKSLQNTIAELHNQIKHLQPADGSFNPTDLRWRLNKVEKEKLELVSRFNEECSAFESQVAKLRAQLEKGEAVRQTLEYDLAVAKKEASVVRSTSEERIEAIHKIHAQLKVHNSELQQKVENLEKTLQVLQQAREDEQERFQSEQEDREKIIKNSITENELLIAERNRIDAILQDQEQTFVQLQKRLKELEVERSNLSDALRRQAKEFEYSTDREERLKTELEVGQQRVKTLEENIEAERAAHLESKFNSEIIQLRIRDLENALEVEKSSHANAVSTLELIKQQLREVEFSYEREKSKVVEFTNQLQKLQKESTVTKTQLTAELEEKNDVIADLSKQLQRREESFENLRDELTKVTKHHAFLEEAYGGSMRELELLLANFAVSGPRTSVDQRDKEKRLSPSVVLENLRQTLTDYQSKLEDSSNELNRVKDLYDKINEQCEAYKELIWSRNENCEKIQEELAEANKKLNHWRNECVGKDALIDSLSLDLQNMKHCFEMEKNSIVETKSEIQKISWAHQQDTEEKLAFLHSLYQRLMAGCVVMKQPDDMLAKFSWTELCSILQENVDTLISDLNKASEKESYLERICRNKEEAIQQLQQNQEVTFNKLTEQMKEREASWQKQKNEMERHYSVLLGEVHSRAQSCYLGAEEAKEKVSSLTKVNDQLTLELSHTKKLLSQKQKEHVALHAACALMAGALYPLYNRSCELSVQKDFLTEQMNTCEYFKNEIRTVVQILSLEENPGKSKKRKKPQRGLIQVFRKSVIAVMAVNRLQAFGRGCRPLFTWSEGIKNKPRLAVFSGCTTSCVSRSRQEQEQNQFMKSVGWLSSSELLTAIVDSMSELQVMITKAHTNHLSNWPMENAAKNSFSKFMDRLSVEMENVSLWCGRHIGYEHKKSLVQLLGSGLCKVNTKAGKEGCQVTMPIKQCVEVLKKQILEFTQRLHAAEVERRSLRLELTQLKNYVSDLKRETGKAHNLEQQLNNLKQSLKTQKMVPFERFGSICEELNNALQREQQAQLLLNDQVHQMQELNLRLEQQSSGEAEKNQTLSEAVMSLSEAKMELRRKDQSLRQLNKNLSQLEQDKRQLEESIQDAENALCKAAKDREHLINYLRSLDVAFQQVRDQISLSWSVTPRNDFTLQLPKLQLETVVSKGPKDGLEVTSLQNLTQTFMDIYQLASSRVAALEAEVTSHQKHIGALKSELQTACLRENNALVPIL